MSSSGYILINRGIWDHFANERFTEREAWIWMIAFAAWKPITIRRGGKTISLDRGQLAYSVRFMARRWRWSKSHVCRYLQRLSQDKMIEFRLGQQVGHLAGQLTPQEVGQQTGQITICNYDKYQLERDSKRDTVGTLNGTLSGTASGTNKNTLMNKNKRGPLVFVSEDSPLWPAMVELWQVEHGRSDGPPVKNFGWHFPAAWVEPKEQLAALYANGKG